MKLTAVAFGYSPTLTLARPHSPGSTVPCPGQCPVRCRLAQTAVALFKQSGPMTALLTVGEPGQELSALNQEPILALSAALSEPRASSVEQVSDSDLKT